MISSEKKLTESGVERPTVRQTIRYAVGVVVLILASFGLMDMALFAVRCRQFLILSVCVSGIGLTWLLTIPIRLIWLRLWLRSFSVAAFLWPFIPHNSIEWSSPFPPAGFWVLNGLRSGQLQIFELVSILVATFVMWLAGIAVYDYRHRKIKPDKEIDRAR